VPDYDFRALSSFDFEQLIRDLLQLELHTRLESFKQGRDGGIDLRYSRLSGIHQRDLIIQCKHYASTPFATLRSHLERNERPKVERLKPSRYLLATSVGLTPLNKQEIVDIFAPYCRGSADILGKDDINNLLGKYSAIETGHFKLWLTSTPVISRVLHSELFNESQAARARIIERMKLYVANRSFHEAKRLLDSAHYCVIVGVPGIGKTTLAETLIVDYLARDYEVFVISNDIRDAFGVLDSSRKQLFYYDDFLGQTGLADKLQKNEDQALVRFVEAAQSSGLTRLVLTTRDYIFNQAKLTYEKIAHARLDHQRCIVDLAAYTKADRAKILFNHIHFSQLPYDYKAALLAGRGYREILSHPNFSPRIIAWMTDLSVHDTTPPKEYLNEFIRNLSHPLRLWEHAYNSQLSNASRHLLLSLATLPDPVRLEDLRQAFDGVHAFQSKRFGFSRTPDDFQHAIKESEANFISVSSPTSQSEVLLVTFHNPSVRDFLYDCLNSNMEQVRTMCESAVYFEQVERILAGFASGQQAENVAPMTRTWLCANPELLWRGIERTFRTESCGLVWNKHRTYVHNIETIYEDRALFALSIANVGSGPEVSAILGTMIEFVYANLLEGRCHPQSLNGLLATVNWSNVATDITSNEFVSAAKSALGIGTDRVVDCLDRDFDEYRAAIEFALHHTDVVSGDEFRELADLFQERVRDYDADGDFEDLEAVACQIEAVATMCEFNLEHEITRLRERATELRDEAESRADDEYDRWRDDEPFETRDDEKGIDDMFDALG
jgi:hypothetical protein